MQASAVIEAVSATISAGFRHLQIIWSMIGLNPALTGVHFDPASYPTFVNDMSYSFLVSANFSALSFLTNVFV